jgi:hypothetical protein
MVNKGNVFLRVADIIFGFLCWLFGEDADDDWGFVDSQSASFCAYCGEKVYGADSTQNIVVCESCQEVIKEPSE